MILPKILDRAATTIERVAVRLFAVADTARWLAVACRATP